MYDFIEFTFLQPLPVVTICMTSYSSHSCYHFYLSQYVLLHTVHIPTTVSSFHNMYEFTYFFPQMLMNVIRQACVARRVSTQRVHTSVDVWKATLSCLTRGLVRLSEVGLRFMTIAKHIESVNLTQLI